MEMLHTALPCEVEQLLTRTRATWPAERGHQSVSFLGSKCRRCTGQLIIPGVGAGQGGGLSITAWAWREVQRRNIRSAFLRHLLGLMMDVCACEQVEQK